MNDDMLEQTADLLRLATERTLTADEVKTLCAATGVRWAWVTNRSTEPSKSYRCEVFCNGKRCFRENRHNGNHESMDDDDRWFYWERS
jgi:hypothetical protein